MAKSSEEEVMAKVKITYDRSLIMPVEEGLKFMQAVAKGEVLNDSYGTVKSLKPVDEEITLSLITAQKVREIRMEQVLEGNGDEDK